MSGKQHKRELKRQKELAREQARREERRRTLFTLVVIGVVVAIGTVLVIVSLDEGEVVAESPTPTPAATPEPIDAEPCEPAPAPENAGQDKPTFESAPDNVLEATADYRATIETSCGTVVVDLYEDRAPQTVNNFVFLAQQGFYDGLKIFRNAPSIFALQTGAGSDEASFQIGYTIPDELTAAEEEGYTPGSLAMANTGQPDSGGSQFFFVYGESPLPPQYAKFGQVVEGLEVLQSIGAIPVEGETPTQDVYLERVTISTATPAAPTEPTTDEPTEEAS